MFLSTDLHGHTYYSDGRATPDEHVELRHKAEVAASYRELADAKRKYWTSSSDDHQNARYIRTPLQTLERICMKTIKLSNLFAA